MNYSPAFIRLYMAMAKTVGTEKNSCPSRQIGVVLVKGKKLSVGYNGPPSGYPAVDSRENINNFVLPQLSLSPLNEINLRNNLVNCGECPRKKLGYGAGEQSSLCPCQHAERNAITNAAFDLTGASAFCYCGVPCIQCAGAIVNAGITEVYHLDVPDYEPVARFIFEKGGVELYPLKERDIA